jgi:RHS repeat-associated protein
MLAAVAWSGNGDGTSWSDPLNWSGQAIPTAADDVTIDVASNPTIQITSGSHSVQSLTSNEALSITGGSLSVGTTAQVSAGLTQSAGSLIGGQWSGSGIQLSGTATLDGVTLNTNVTALSSASLTFRNGLTLNSSLSLPTSATASLYFTGSQSLTGTGQIVLGYSSQKIYVRGTSSTVPATLTVGSGVTIRGLGTVQGYYSGDSLVNQGIIQGDVTSWTLTVSAPLTNSGTLATSGAGSLSVGSLQSNTGTIRVGSSSSDTGTLTLGGTWSSTGSLVVNGGKLNLGGSFTLTGEENYTYGAGTVNLTGTLNNTGDTLTLGSNTGAWTLNGGTILGGTIAGSGGPWLKLYDGTLNGVTLNTDATVTYKTTVKNGLILNSTLSLPTLSSFSYFQGTQSLTGTGQIVVGHSYAKVYVQGTSSTVPATLTVGSGVTIRGVGTVQGYYSGDSLVNQGVIQGDVTSWTLTVSAPLTNSGTLATSGAGSLVASNLQTNTGTIRVGSSSSDTGTLTLGGTWSSTGSLVVNGGKLNLGGSFTLTGEENYSYGAGTVNLTGTLNNTGDTLTLGSNTGVWTLNGGTILGGTIAGSGGPWLKLNDGTLDGVTLNTDATVSYRATVKNGLTLNGRVSMPIASSTWLYFQGSQSLAGTGQIALGYLYAKVCVQGTSSTVPATLTVGSGVTIRGVGTVQGSYSGDGLVNQGVIQGDVTSGTLTVSAPLTNSGTLATSGAGILSVSSLQSNTGTIRVGSGSSDTGTLTLGGTWSSTGSLVVNGGTLNLGGSFTTAGLGTVSYTAGTVNLTGTLDNTDSTLTLGSNTGVWTLYGGTVLGGTIAGSGGPWLKLHSGTLDGVTLNVDTTVLAAGTSIVQNGLTLNSALAVPTDTKLYFRGSQALMGTGQVLAGLRSTIYVQGTSSTEPATLTVGQGATIHGQGTLRGVYTGDSLVNQGTIQGDSSGMTLTVSLPLTNNGMVATSGSGNLTVSTFTNDGTVQASGSGTLTIANLTNTGTARASNSGTLSIANLTNSGTVQAGCDASDTGKVTLTGAWTNLGTFLLMGDATLTRGGIISRGDRAAVSGTEILLSWRGLEGDADTTYVVEVSSDGTTYLPFDTTSAAHTMFLATSLIADTSYRMRVVAENTDGGREVYDSDFIATLDAPDTSGWYRVPSLTLESDGSVVDPATIGINDTTWVFAGTRTGAFLKTLANNDVVTDASVPIIDDSGVAKVWHVSNPELNWDFYTLDSTRYPSGAYSLPEWHRTLTGYAVNVLSTILNYLGAPFGSPSETTDPTRYADGAVDYRVTDIESDGLSSGFSQSRSWINNTQWTVGGLMGIGWSDDSMPTLRQLSGDNTIAVVYSATNIVNFVLTNGQYVPTAYTADALVHDTTNHLFILTDSSGNEYTFNDFSSSVDSSLQGQFVSETDAYGLLTRVTERTESGAVQTLCRYAADGTTVLESWTYAYISSSATSNAGMIQSVTFQQRENGALTTIKTAAYTYYNGTYSGDDRDGNLGDLKTAIVTKADGTITSAYYYRYYTLGDCRDYVGTVIDHKGYTHGLKYVFDTEAYAKLLASLGESSLSSSAAFSAADSAVAAYAEHYFEYDRDRRVTRHDVQGVGMFTYSYTTNSTYSEDANTWLTKTVETTPDGRVNLVYCNSMGEIMLKVTYDDSTLTDQEAITYYQYDADGRVIRKAEGEAVTGYSDSYSDLLHHQNGNYEYLSDASGAIYQYEFGTSTTATATTAGDVHGRLKASTVRHGELGSAVLLDTTDYFVNTADGRRNVAVAHDTVYTDGTTATAQPTSYAYTWYTGTVAIQSTTATLPEVLINGTATSPVYEYAYDTYGRLAQATDPLGVTTVYAYDLLGRITQTIENYVDGQYSASSPSEDLTTSYAYDALGRVTRVTDPLGNTTYYVYNDANRETRVYAGWNATTHNTTGAITVFREDLFGNYTETLAYTWTDPDGLADYLNADGSPNGAEPLTSPYVVFQALRRSLKNASGQVVAVRDYVNLTGLAYSTAPTLGTKNVHYYQTDTTYGPWGDVTSLTDGCGNTTTYTYDGLGNVVSSTDALNHVTTYDYDINGNLVSVTDAEGVTTTYEYNYLGQRVKACQHYVNGVHDATDDADEDVLTSYTYNVLGDLLTVTDALGNVTTYAYDALGQRTSAMDALGHTTAYAYDLVGNLLSVTDGEGHTTTYAYNALGDRTSTTDGNGDATTYTYDANGNLLTLTDAEGNTTSYTYDALDRVVQETNELGASRAYVYSDVGKLVQETDRNGRVTTSTYDALGRITAENWLDTSGNVIATTTYAYDAVGDLLSVANSQAAYTYTYDALGRITSETQSFDDLTPTVVLAYQYDDLGNVTQVAATIGGTADYVTDYTYDTLGRVASIRQHGVTGGNAVAEKRIDFTYDTLGQYATITTYADLAATDLVTTATYTFDDAYRLVGLSYTKGTTTLASYAYTYDDAGNMTGMTTVDGTTSYTYDNAGQLVSADSNYTDDESYTYDDNGNRVTANGDSYATGDDNQLLSDGSYAYTYDAEGNRTAKFLDTDADGLLDSGDTDITTYTWDYRNRLTEVEHYSTYANYTAGASDETVQYAYDAFNRLIGRTLDADGTSGTGDIDQTVYVYDGDQIALQFDKTSANGSVNDLSASDLSHRYLWNPQAIDQLFADEEAAGEGLLFALTDHEGTVRDLAVYDPGTDSTTVANHHVYDAYGNLKSETNSAVDCLFGYTGRVYDEATGLQNNLNRWYDATIGRWLSEDPLGFVAGDANMYRYVGNAATNAIDPWGLKPGDKFNTMDEAAIDWGKTYNEASINEGREKGSSIYRTADGKYSYTEPNTGGPTGVDPSVPNPTKDPDAVETVADIHSHGAYRSPGSEIVSDDDVDTILDPKRNPKQNPLYTVTPGGKLWKLDPKNVKKPTQQVSNNMPRDERCPK